VVLLIKLRCPYVLIMAKLGAIDRLVLITNAKDTYWVALRRLHFCHLSRKRVVASGMMFIEQHTRRDNV